MMKSQQQDIDREGRRLLRESLEPLGWVLTGFEEDSVSHLLRALETFNSPGVQFVSLADPAGARQETYPALGKGTGAHGTNAIDSRKNCPCDRHLDL
jgi:hypothetical protein